MTDLERLELKFDALLEQNKEIIAALKNINETMKTNPYREQLALCLKNILAVPLYRERSEYPRIKAG